MAKKGTKVNPQVKLNVIRKFNFMCMYCNTTGSQKNFLTIDHVFPRALGGSNAQENLACCCKNCNEKKGKLLLTTFLKRNKIGVTREIDKFL